MFRRTCPRSGFSLVEMAVAVVIFSGGVLATTEVFSVCLRAAGTSRDHTRAVLLAQGVMEESAQQGPLIEGETNGEFGQAFPGAKWTREVKLTETAGLYAVRVRVTWPAPNGEQALELTTLAAER